jgi:hypothetical protein
MASVSRFIWRSRQRLWLVSSRLDAHPGRAGGNSFGLICFCPKPWLRLRQDLEEVHSAMRQHVLLKQQERIWLSTVLSEWNVCGLTLVATQKEVP